MKTRKMSLVKKDVNSSFNVFLNAYLRLFDSSSSSGKKKKENKS